MIPKASLLLASGALALLASCSSSTTTPPDSTGPGAGGTTSGSTGGSSPSAGRGGSPASGGQAGASAGAAGQSAAGKTGTGGSAGTTSAAGSGGQSTGQGGAVAGSGGAPTAGSGGSAGGAVAGSGGASTAGSGGSGPSGGSSPGTTCAADATEITTLPACSSPDSSMVSVGPGCGPTVDGTLHAAEWVDSTCFVVGAGDMTVDIKYAGDTLYLSTSGKPSCGCPMLFQFDPDGGATVDGDEFALGLFDDPGGMDGDRFDVVVQGGKFKMGTAPAGIVTRVQGMTSMNVHYEISIPLAALGITPGTAHTFGFGILHAAVGWPTSLTPDAGVNYSSNVAAYGRISSPSNWQ